MLTMSLLRSRLGAAVVCLVLAPLGVITTALQTPSAEAIVERHLSAVGGRAALQKVTSLVLRGTIEFVGTPLKGTFVSYRTAPAHVYMVSELPGFGKFEEGSDGGIAWAKVPGQGARIKSGVEQMLALRDAEWNGDLRWREVFPTIKLDGTESVDGEPAYRVVMTPKDGPAMTRYYDQKSGLLVRGSVTITGPQGAVGVESRIGDYRKVGDLLVPHRLTQKLGGPEIVIKVERVMFNEAIPAERFIPPPDVKALLGK